VPIGRPIAETCLYVLDAWGQPAPIGVAGELYIGGAGLARGYVGQPAGTAARFVPDAWSGIAGARVYRTGDRARWRADGQLEFLGRADHQVKVRGYRIELGEVEAALEQCDSVRAAVVVAQRVPTTGDRAASDNATGDRATGDGALRLVAYVVTDGRPVAAVREQLATLLPAYMIPSAIIPLERLPLTANGKVDHAALPSASGETHLEDYEAPRTPDEERVARVWADVLSLERVSIQDDFFALGGHSLLADRLIARLRRDFDIELPLRSIFERPTIAALTEAIVAAKAAGACHDAPAVVPIARAARRVSLAAIRDI
jgi:acyl carrier protein